MKQISGTQMALIVAVRDHALAHYEDGGWDVIVECWDDETIAETLSANRESGRGTVRTTKGAIARMAAIVDIYADRQADARNSAF